MYEDHVFNVKKEFLSSLIGKTACEITLVNNKVCENVKIVEVDFDGRVVLQLQRPHDKLRRVIFVTDIMSVDILDKDCTESTNR